MIKKIKKEHEQFLKKLKVKYPLKIDKFYKTKNIGRINRIFYSKGRKIWFAHSENENKYFYIFGIVNSSPDDVSLEDYILIYDFPKNEIYNKNCLGMINKNNLYVDKNILIKKYRNINLNNYSIKKSAIFQGTYINVETIDMGNINGNFIENIEKLIKEIEKIKPVSRENLFLNSIKAGKTVEESLKIANITKEELDLWLESGKNNDKKYAKFYKKYNELINSGVSKTANDNLMTSYYNLVSQNKTINFDNISKINIIKMNVFLDEYSKDKKLSESLKKANLNLNEFNSWIEKGKDKSSEYNKFYNEYIKIKETPKIIKNSDKISKNKELMDEFIKLKQEGKTNNEALEKVNIPQYLVKNWINQGKLGNSEYYNFYQAYTIDNTPKPKVKQKILLENDKNKKEIKDKTIPHKCSICGRLLNKNSEKNICKRCLRKQYAVSILEKLLPSIEPGIPFRKDDLKLINLKKLQIQDYIWTLQEFNLITKENSKYIIKPRDTLDKFAHECNLEIKIDEKSSVSLSKTCETCGETLEISNFYTSENSDDGYENNCKKCKKLIKSAVFLKKLNKYIKWEEEFSENDLKPYFKDAFRLKGNIWNLLENDLIKNKFNTQNYILTDEKTGLEFIKKYYKEEYDTPLESPQTKETKKPTNKNKREIVLDAMSRRRTRKEASIIAEIPLYKITHWFNEGKQGFGKENIDFYNKLKEIEQTNNPYSQKEVKKQNSDFITSFKENKDIEKACKKSNINKITLEDWIILGENNIHPYKEFINEYNKINRELNKKLEDKDIQNDILNMIKEGLSIQDAAKKYKNGSYEKSILSWFEYGKLGEEEFKEFYKKCKEYDVDFFDLIKQGYDIREACNKSNLEYEYVKNKLESKEDNFYNNFIEAKILNQIGEYPTVKQKKSIGSQSIIKLMNKILKLLIKGKTEKEACKIVDFPYDTYKYWIYRGNQNIGEIYVNFYNEVTRINKIKSEIEIELNAYLKAAEHTSENIDYEKYKDLLKPIANYSTQSNRTGFGWTNKIGNQWIYTKSINKKQLKITDENLYILFEKVIESGNIWGVIDKEKAIKTLRNQYHPNNNWNINQFLKLYGSQDIDTHSHQMNTYENMKNNILTPLPETFEDKFSTPSKTGFAWVNKVGNKWFYLRSMSGQTINLSNYDIYKLHEEVLERNLVWGVRDLDKAKKSLKETNNIKTTPSSKSSKNLITINVPVDKKDKKSLKILAERNKKSMRELLTKEANTILNENKIINHHNKIKNSVYLLFQIDEDLKNQVNDYTPNFNDFWNTALDNILNHNTDTDFDETTHNLDFFKTVEKPSSKQVTINIKVDKNEKNRLKSFAESNNTSMKDLLNNEAINILNENKTITSFNKTGDTAPLVFQLDENLKEQIETYSFKNEKNLRDFWNTALHYILHNQNSENINPQDEKIEINQNFSKTDITITYVKSNENEINTIIQGLLDNKELINSLNQLKIFEDNITRIITNKINKEIDLFIEINIPLSYINNFEEIISNLNWKINK